MESIEIVTQREGVIINPTKEHYEIGLPESVFITTNLNYRKLEIIYGSKKIPSKVKEELSRFAYDYSILQINSSINSWVWEIPPSFEIISSCDF